MPQLEKIKCCKLFLVFFLFLYLFNWLLVLDNVKKDTPGRIIWGKNNVDGNNTITEWLRAVQKGNITRPRKVIIYGNNGAKFGLNCTRSYLEHASGFQLKSTDSSPVSTTDKPPGWNSLKIVVKNMAIVGVNRFRRLITLLTGFGDVMYVKGLLT